jgi:hypothetical protein
MTQVAVGHQRRLRTAQVTRQATFRTKVPLMLSDRRECRGSAPERPEKPDEHQSTADQQDNPEYPSAGSFTRHKMQATSE